MKSSPTRFLVAATLLVLLAPACSKALKDVFYLPIIRTVWYQLVAATNTTKEQEAFLCFPDEQHVSLFQTLTESGITSVSNGVYDADGHSVLCGNSNGEGNTVKFIRTFSHLKNSKNKNLTGMPIHSPSTLMGSIWATVVKGELYVGYFSDDSHVVSLAHHADGWHASSVPCRLEGSRLEVTRTNGNSTQAILYQNVMLLDSLGILCTSPALEAVQETAWSGSLWVTEGQGKNPAVLVFPTAGACTRIQLIPHEQYNYFSTLKGKPGSNPPSGDTFVFEGDTYTRVSLH